MERESMESLKCCAITLAAVCCIGQAQATKIGITNTSNSAALRLRLDFEGGGILPFMQLAPGEKIDYELGRLEWGTHKPLGDKTISSVEVKTVANTLDFRSRTIKEGPKKDADKSKKVKSIDLAPDNIKITYTDGSVDQS